MGARRDSSCRPTTELMEIDRACFTPHSLTNPVENTEKVSGGWTYSPRPDWAFELFFQHARIGLHLPVYSGLYTGQRSVDIFKMKHRSRRLPKCRSCSKRPTCEPTCRFIPSTARSSTPCGPMAKWSSSMKIPLSRLPFTC